MISVTNLPVQFPFYSPLEQLTNNINSKKLVLDDNLKDILRESDALKNIFQAIIQNDSIYYSQSGQLKKFILDPLSHHLLKLKKLILIVLDRMQENPFISPIHVKLQNESSFNSMRKRKLKECQSLKIKNVNRENIEKLKKKYQRTVQTDFQNRMNEYMENELGILDSGIRQANITLYHYPHNDLSFEGKDYIFKISSSFLKDSFSFIEALVSNIDKFDQTSSIINLTSIEEEIEIDIPSECFMKFLLFFSTGKISLTQCEFFVLFALSNYMGGNRELNKVLIEYITDHPQVCLPLLSWMENIEKSSVVCQDFYRTLLHVCLTYPEPALNVPHFFLISTSLLIEIFSCKDLKLDENEVCQFLHLWVCNKISPHSWSKEERELIVKDVMEIVQKCLNIVRLSSKNQAKLKDLFFLNEQEVEWVKQTQQIYEKRTYNREALHVRWIDRNHAVIKWNCMVPDLMTTDSSKGWLSDPIEINGENYRLVLKYYQEEDRELPILNLSLSGKTSCLEHARVEASFDSIDQELESALKDLRPKPRVELVTNPLSKEVNHKKIFQTELHSRLDYGLAVKKHLNLNLRYHYFRGKPLTITVNINVNPITYSSLNSLCSINKNAIRSLQHCLPFITSLRELTNDLNNQTRHGDLIHKTTQHLSEQIKSESHVLNSLFNCFSKQIPLPPLLPDHSSLYLYSSEKNKSDIISCPQWMKHADVKKSYGSLRPSNNREDRQQTPR